MIVGYITDASKFDLHNFKSMISFPAHGSTTGGATSKAGGAMDMIKSLFAKLKSGGNFEQDLFTFVDMLTGNHGGITPDAFVTLANRLGIPLTLHRVQEIYADIKGAAVEAGELKLDAGEFQKALMYLKNQQLEKAMTFLGITPAMLYATLAYLLFLLAIIFAFIFLGIQAFTVGGSFSAVINSLMPAMGALSVGGDDKKEAGAEHVQAACSHASSIVSGQTTATAAPSK